jgi:hypothetical protein
MKCPECLHDMEIRHTDVTHNGEGQKYDRVVYVCEKEDLWISIEKPQAGANPSPKAKSPKVKKKAK